MKILLIEPDKILGGVAVEALMQSSHKVIWCRSAQSALDAMEADQPDIIILELQIGLHNGIEFLYELRSYPEWQRIPVIIHTINANVLDERFTISLQQLGIEKILYKPHTSAKKLVQAVRLHITL